MKTSNFYYIIYSLLILLSSKTYSYSQQNPGQVYVVKLKNPDYNLSYHSSNINYSVDLNTQQYAVRFPKPPANCNYKLGLITFVSPDQQNLSMEESWPQVLDKFNLIYISPVFTGNSMQPTDRLGYAIQGTLFILKNYPIDKMRIYSSGFSGGSRIANALCFYQPDIYRGCVLNCGVDFPYQVPKIYSTSDTDTEGNRYGCSILTSQKMFEYVRNYEKFAIITGSNDFRRDNILDIFYGGFSHYGFKAKLFNIPNMGHQICNGKVLEEALNFITN